MNLVKYLQSIKTSSSSAKEGILRIQSSATTVTLAAPNRTWFTILMEVLGGHSSFTTAHISTTSNYSLSCAILVFTACAGKHLKYHRAAAFAFRGKSNQLIHAVYCCTVNRCCWNIYKECLSVMNFYLYQCILFVYLWFQPIGTGVYVFHIVCMRFYQTFVVCSWFIDQLQVVLFISLWDIVLAKINFMLL